MSPEDALGYVLGYTCANDVTARDLQSKDGQWTRSKSFDTFCPLGPFVVSGVDPSDLEITMLVNGKVVQEDSTDTMEWDMHYLVADLARTITLVPGDMIYSGTPANSRPVQPGDVVEVEVDGLGRLTNHVVEGPEPIRTDVGAQPTSSEEVVSTALGGDWEFRGIRTPSADLYPSRITATDD